MRVATSWLAALWFVAITVSHAKPAPREADDALSGPSFPVGNLSFTIPARWQIEPVENAARGGQWRVPPLHPDGEGGEVIAYFFGPGTGGNANHNIAAWIGTMSAPGGHPADKQWTYAAGGFKISQVAIFGTYNQLITAPGIPPLPHANYGLLGTVIENPAGNIYWRFTAPEPLLTATLPLFNKMIGSLKLQGTK